MRADRLLRLLMLLRGKRIVTAAELADELEVSQRTVLRDIDALANAGVPVYAERGRYGGFSLMSGWTTDLSGLTAAEARALLVAGSSVTGALGLGEAFGGALAKVLSSVPAEHRDAAGAQAARILVVDSTFTEPAAPPPHLSTVQRAVTSGRRLRLTYQRGSPHRDRSTAAGAPPTVRTVDAAGLVCAGGTWYLLAAHRGRPRTYRVGRIRRASVLDQPARREHLPDIVTWWERARAEFAARRPTVRVQLIDQAIDGAHPDSGALHMVGGRELDDQRLPDGRRLRTFVFGDLDHARAVLWGHVDRIQVVSPTVLRDEFADRARRALGLLTEPTPDVADCR